MRNILTLLLVCCCFSPAFAQKGKIIQGALGGRAALTDAVTRQAAKQTVTASQVRLAQITNLPGQPTVQVQLPQTAVADSPVLSARILPSLEVYKSVSLAGSRQLYVPDVFAETKDVLYRGMRLTKLSDLENLLLRGLEIRRTAYSELYFAYAFSRAMDYALPMSVTEKAAGDFPVVVKVPVTTELPVSCTGVNAQAYKDLPAEFISDVMVFMEINGRTDWYKAIAENNKLVLISVPTTRMPGYLAR